ncbi:MAG: DUF721 domain-containing protein [Desulfohalobiaceae bacterium]|nr:DUF721 domain-containing protein [Desulfohalobiaceae bacterium]
MSKTMPMRNLAQILDEYISRRNISREFQIAGIWKNWSHIVGPRLIELARPLGKRKKTLVIGVENSLAMQELVFYSEQILEQVEEYLGWQPFDKISFELLHNSTSLDQLSLGNDYQARPVKIPDSIGGLKGRLPEESAVGSCYRAYLRLLGKERQNEG